MGLLRKFVNFLYLALMETNGIYDVTIVGGGIVGLATAYKLSERLKGKGLRLLVLEKEKELAFHQTGHNSGVIHSGLYYKPGSLRATNCKKGRLELVEYAKKYKLPHDVCGKIVVATKESELPYMEKIFQNGIANETEGIEIIDPEQIREIEPYCEGIKAIWVPCAGIADYRAVARQHATLFEANGGQVELDCRVNGFEKSSTQTKIDSKKGLFKSRYVIVCGGAQSDRLARKDGLDPKMKIVSFRGEYYELTNKEKIRNLIYPIPNPAFPFLGVHFTRMTDGSIECGPNAVFAFSREGYSRTAFNFKDTLTSITHPGFLKLASRNLTFGIVEQWRSISKRAFLKNLQGLLPSLQMDEIEMGRVGVRALALPSDGNMIDDYLFVHNDNSIHVLNAPSPAATSSLAIGAQVAEMAVERFNLC